MNSSPALPNSQDVRLQFRFFWLLMGYSLAAAIALLSCWPRQLQLALDWGWHLFGGALLLAAGWPLVSFFHSWRVRRPSTTAVCILLIALVTAAAGLTWSYAFRPGFIASDKLLHLLAYGVLTCWFTQLYRTPIARAKLALWLTGFGIVVEGLQFFLPLRTVNSLDVVANVIGVSLGLALSASRANWGSLLLSLERRLTAAMARRR